MPPSAYVIAKETCQIFPVQRKLIQDMIADACPIAANLLKLLSHYMRDNTSRIIKDRAEIWELSDHVNVDALTRLYNRRWLDNTFIRLLEQSVKCEYPLPLCILLIDVDTFKHYNDTLGHSSGDQALISLGEVLRSSIRIYDYAVRYGGEEFLIILPNTNRAEGIATAERIRKNAAKKTIITPEGARLPSITISIGLAMSKTNSTPKALIDEADEQLYRAKESGRNCIRY
jgi:diguanylate cyclase (GGDEF)-like protein